MIQIGLELFLNSISGDTYVNKTKLSCLEVCARMPLCRSVYFNHATGDCFTQKEKLACSAELETNELIFEKQDRDEQYNENLVSAYFVNTSVE